MSAFCLVNNIQVTIELHSRHLADSRCPEVHFSALPLTTIGTSHKSGDRSFPLVWLVLRFMLMGCLLGGAGKCSWKVKTRLSGAWNVLIEFCLALVTWWLRVLSVCRRP